MRPRPRLTDDARRCFQALWWALVVAALSGCAVLTPHAPATAGLPADPSSAGLFTVQIDAPAELKALLERHLDLVRFSTLARGETVGETEWLRLMQAAPAQVRELLRTEGYFSPTVRLQRLGTTEAGTPTQVRLAVQPGPLARISRTDIEFEGPLAVAAASGDHDALRTMSEARAAWPLRAGTAFRNRAWVEAKAQLLSRLRAAGYAAATMTGSVADVDEAAGTVRLFLVVDAGPLFRSGELEVEGLRLHDRQTVLNLAAFGPGTVLTESALLDFQDRLQKSGLFERASVALDPDPEKASASRVMVQVEEARAQQLVLGVGYSANTGQRATVEHLHRHLFGLAVSARNKAEWGRDRQAWEGEVSTHPGPGLRRWIAGGALERLEGPSDVVLTQRLRVGQAQDTPLAERLTFLEADRSMRRTSGGRSDAVAYSLNQHWSWRRLDSPLLPTDGYTLSLQGGAGHALDGSGSQGAFARVWTRLTAYRPLGQGWYGQGRLEVGQVVSPAGVDVPDVLRFRAGGDDSVRGYAYRSLGPLVNGTLGGGRSVLTASVEVARPLSERLASFWGAVFVDAGNAAESFAQWRPALGYGAGLRWRSPVGPLRLDLAYGRDVGAIRLHFSVGIAF